MAILRVKQQIVNNADQFVFSIESISESDQQLISQFGELTIDFGGSFNNGSGLSFTLPNNTFKLPSQFPVVITADPTTAPFSVSTDTSLALYRTTISTRVTSAFTALRANDSTFIGEFVTNL